MNREKILVTGGLGFIGSNYLNKFVRLYPECRFINIDAETYAANRQNIKVGAEPNYSFVKADIRDLTGMKRIFAEYEPDGIIHFAAETHVDKSIAGPAMFIETNIVGTHNLLALSREFAVKRFHQISTDEVYGSLSPSAPAFTTASPLKPNSPYSASKAAADLLVRSYVETFSLPAVITRCSNNYGPNQDASKLIPKFISLLLAGEKVPLYAAGENIRDWIFVEDHIDAIDLVFRQGEPGRIYNVGGNCEVRNIDLAKKLCALAGRGEDAISFVADRPGHDFRYAIDNTEISREFDWRPRHGLEESLTRTFAFYRESDRP